MNCGLKLLTGIEEEKVKKKFSRFLFNNGSGYFICLHYLKFLKIVIKVDYHILLHKISINIYLLGLKFTIDVSLSDAIYLVVNAFYHASDLYDEDYSEHVMPHDFYN